MFPTLLFLYTNSLGNLCIAQNASFETFKKKVDYSIYSIISLISGTIVISVNFEAKSTSQRTFVEQKVDQFFLQRFQKKCFQRGYDISK